MVSELIKYFDDDKYWKSKHSGVMINLTKKDRLELDTNLELIDIDLQPVVDYVVSNGYKTILCIMRTKQVAGLGYDVPHKDTYKLLDWLLDWQIKNNGIEIIVNRDRSLLKDILKAQNSSGSRLATIPAFGESGGMLRRQCTGEYKIQPVIQSVRKLYGLKKYKRMLLTEMWLGITIDEAQRMKISSHKKIINRYPFLELMMTRSDCKHFMKKNNFPIPIKSACVFCPYHSDSNWKEIKRENGKAWKTSIEVDRAIRDSSHRGWKDKLYLHRSCKPLDEIDFNDDQLDMFDNDCDGHCGL